MHRLPSDVAVRCSRRSHRATVIVPASGSRTMRPSASEPCASDGICCLPEGPDGTDAPIPASDYRSRSADGRIHRRLTPVSHTGAGRGAPPFAGSHRRSGGKKRPVRTGPVSGEVPQRRGTDAPAAHAAQTPSSKLYVAFLACCEKRGPAPMRRADQASAYDQVSDRADGFPGKITLRQGDNGWSTMQRRVSVNGRHVMVDIEETSPGSWSASAEHMGTTLVVAGNSANRAASEWAVRANATASDSPADASRP